MGPRQHTASVKPAGQRLRRRSCLRKGCDGVFRPVRWNQRYCRDPECLRQVRRWQAAKRQRAHRRSPANRKRHAEAEARRRRARTATTEAREASPPSRSSAAAGGAWSRGTGILGNFCDRPGCYEPLPENSRAPARYCGRPCRAAVRRVLDRERKWLYRNGHEAPDKHGASAQTAVRRPCGQSPTIVTATRRGAPGPVGGYVTADDRTLSCSRSEHREPPERPHDDHSKTGPDPRPRPPPSR